MNTSLLLNRNVLKRTVEIKLEHFRSKLLTPTEAGHLSAGGADIS
jgi:hypothetical protein